MIRSVRLGTTWTTAQQAGWAQGNCPPGMVQNASDCIDPTSYAGICPPNQQAYGPSGPPSVMTFAQQQAGQFTCGPIAAAPAITSQAALVAAQTPAPSPAPIVMPNVSPTITIPTPVATIPAPAAASPTNFTYTADIETVQNQLDLSGDTWDSAQAIVGQLYAAGIAPGTVTSSMALNYMTGVTDTTISATVTSLTTLPWYYYAAGAGALFLFFGSSSSRK